MRPFLAFRRAVLGLCLVSVAGCGSIGTVNGVPLSEPRSIALAQSAEERHWCRRSDENRLACIAGIILLGGAITWGIIELTDDDDDRRRPPGGGGGGGEEEVAS